MNKIKLPIDTRLSSLRRANKNNCPYTDFGINYNSNRVLPFMSFKNDNEYVDNMERDLIPNKPVFLYLCSGTEEIERFSQLDNFPNIILVDYMFKEYSCLKYPDKNIITLPLDAIVAIQILTKLNIIIDAYCCQNEGLCYGGANYAINSNVMLGLLFPLFNSERIAVIASKNYYKRNGAYKVAKTFFDIPFQHKRVLKTKEEIESVGINQSLDFFTTYPNSSSKSEVMLFSNKINNMKHSFYHKGVRINVVHASIWEYRNELDIMFSVFQNRFQEVLIRRCCKKIVDWDSVYQLGDTKYEFQMTTDILQIANDLQLEKLGFIPCHNDYLGFINELTSSESCVKEISFFHLNHNDFKVLYNINNQGER